MLCVCSDWRSLPACGSWGAPITQAAPSLTAVWLVPVAHSWLEGLPLMPRKLGRLGITVVTKHVLALTVGIHWWVCSQAPSAGAAGGTLACATVLWELCADK